MHPGTSKIGRITGLDPASIGFLNERDDFIDRRLHKSDAEFVMAIHTDTWSPSISFGCGTYIDSGHVDIFVNNGTDQPH